MNNFDRIISEYKFLLEELLSSNPLPFGEKLRCTIPNKSGVYRIFEINSQCNESIYIGKSANLQNRLYRNHLMGNRRGSTLKRKLIERGYFSSELEVKKYLTQKCLVQYVLIAESHTIIGFEHFVLSILSPKIND